MRPSARAASRITAAGLLSAVPLIGRRAGQGLARRELSKAIYQPSLWQRFAGWLGHLVHGAGAGVPGRWWALVAAVLAAVLAGGVVRALGWPGLPGRRRVSRPVLAGPPRAAADHRRAAERLAAAGDYSAAIVELVRAIAAELEERGVLAPHPGRTAGELAAEAGAAFPALRSELHAAARLFDDVRYGDRAGTQAGYQSIQTAYAGLRSARPSRSAGGGPDRGARPGAAPTTGAVAWLPAVSGSGPGRDAGTGAAAGGGPG